MGPDERVRTALLAGLTVAALAVGGWWWQNSAPALGPTGPSPSPSASASPDRTTVRLDPATGQVLGSADPEDTVVFHVGPGEPPIQGDAGQELWRERSHLKPTDPPLARQSGASGAQRYLLSVQCAGPGAVAIEISGAQDDPSPPNVRCTEGGGEFMVVEGAGGQLTVRFTALEGEVDLDARLSGLS
jgi:hypothetical protein